MLFLFVFLFIYYLFLRQGNELRVRHFFIFLFFDPEKDPETFVRAAALLTHLTHHFFIFLFFFRERPRDLRPCRRAAHSP